MPEPTDADRARYATQIAAGTEQFFEPRSTSCPWCRSPRLSVRLRTTDILQGKPGRFVLEKCATCGHVFQNPRLNPAGLDFYYRDFYDGFGSEFIDGVFSSQGWLYEPRARMVEPFFAGGTGPKAWLDVGTGYGHFCQLARTIWPDTAFDGLDMGATVDIGHERGWLDSVYRGEFDEHADVLAGRYDVLSMHHYLEHVRDPRAELDTAARVLGDGAYLQIEVPDVTSWLTRIFGRWWAPWYQPQHQHLIPLPNLLAALTERGLTPVAVHRDAAHIAGELSCALIYRITSVAPEPGSPWLPEPTEADLRRHERIWKIAPSLLKTTARLDFHVLAPLVRRLHGSNAYRVLARRERR